MLAIRLKRVGRKNDPSFRIIVQDSRRSPKRTRGLVEYVGFYDARKGKPVINAERVQYWMSVGAQPSDTVHNLLVDAKIVGEKKVNAHNKKTKPVKEVPKEEVKPAVAVAPKVEAPAPVVETPAPVKEEVKEEVAPAPVAEEKTPEPTMAEKAVEATVAAASTEEAPVA